ncbi:MAG TPA: sulfite exporter TauE/SafE family protein [Longimicrobium sp.]|nr:sulfite exporter TauE/SafE family protein [Longimicrobium sp.]
MGNWIFLLIGLAAGVLAGLFGVGGGIVIVPALIFLARMEPQTATGTSLAALLLPVGALGAYEYYKHGHLNVLAAALLALGLFLGAGVGARFSLQLSGVALRRVFAVFLALIAIRMWFSQAKDGAETPAPAPGAVQ